MKRRALISKLDKVEDVNTLQQHNMKKIIETAIKNAATRSQQLSNVNE